jgi:hypothetical protein
MQNKSFEERKELSYELQYKNLKERYDLLSEKYLKLNSDYLDKCKKEAPKETNIEKELEEAADEYRYLNGKVDVELSAKIQKTCYLYDGVNKLMVDFATSDIAKKIHQQEAVDLIRELTERLKSITDDYVLAPDDAEDNNEAITNAENFLKSKK